MSFTVLGLSQSFFYWKPEVWEQDKLSAKISVVSVCGWLVVVLTVLLYLLFMYLWYRKYEDTLSLQEFAFSWCCLWKKIVSSSFRILLVYYTIWTILYPLLTGWNYRQLYQITSRRYCLSLHCISAASYFLFLF